ncbi:MAG TPA: thioesterase family protein [Burkholderiales bacterium]|nr:thioesterase family protein [Burkholderiales bacterium]
MAKSFRTERKIRFSHCDPAGIVYFVNFFDMVSGAVEDWFGEAIGWTFDDMHLRQRVGFPIVNTGCEFFRPCHLGDVLTLELEIAKLGRSSIEFRVTGRVAGEEKFRARHKVAMMSLDAQRALPIPDELRAQMLPYVTEAP